MEEDSDTPVGVKMLADHLVKVKLQYEERINEMILHMRTVEREKEEMRKQYKQMEEELETRRNEIFQMKRESSSQYVMEERENWKARLLQQQQLIAKLQKDLEISQDRAKSLQEQLDDREKKEMEEMELKNNRLPETTSTPLGPPQPQLPIDMEEDEEFMSNMEIKPLADQPSFLNPSSSDVNPTQTQQTMQAMQAMQAMQDELTEVKQLNSRLTDQFIHRVDELEREHRERENNLIIAIDTLRQKLDFELERKWELQQQLKSEEDSRRGILSFLWG